MTTLTIKSKISQCADVVRGSRITHGKNYENAYLPRFMISSEAIWLLEYNVRAVCISWKKLLKRHAISLVLILIAISLLMTQYYIVFTSNAYR